MKRCNSIEEAETYYLKLSNEEQKKYDHLNEIIRKNNREKTISNRRGLFNNTEWTNIVVRTFLIKSLNEISFHLIFRKKITFFFIII